MQFVSNKKNNAIKTDSDHFEKSFFFFYFFPQDKQENGDNLHSVEKKLPQNRFTANSVQTSSVKGKQEIRQENSTNGINSINKNRAKTFSTQKQLLQEKYNWEVEFPSTAIHSNSIMYRDTEQNRSFKIKLRTINDRVMLGNRLTKEKSFGGSCNNLAVNKVKQGVWFDKKLAKSDQSIVDLNDGRRGSVKNSKSLLNLLSFPFNSANRGKNNNNSMGNLEPSWKRKIVNFWRRKNRTG